MYNYEITSRDKLATIEFQLNWNSENARHSDRFTAERVNFWRDVFPSGLDEQLMNKLTGEIVDVPFPPGGVVPRFSPAKTGTLKRSQFDTKFRPDENLVPRVGRYYPKGILKDVSGIFRANVEPFRLVGVENGSVDIDMNHPLSPYEVQLKAVIRDVRAKFDERGGTSNDWLEVAAEGPGMQARLKNRMTDFFSDNPFERQDEANDAIFYGKPRFVQHLDDTAIENVSGVYSEFLRPGMKVLDLMSSWQSHIPGNLELEKVVGLGMNEEELAANPRLTEYLTKDLNVSWELPFSDSEFDAIVCTASIEYLNRPFEVFGEAARVLKPGGVFAVSFSNRWFPPKAIRIWGRIHEFERVGLVMEYFLDSSLYEDLHTISIRGLPRPHGDKYARQFAFSDPVYAVVAKRK